MTDPKPDPIVEIFARLLPVAQIETAYEERTPENQARLELEMRCPPTKAVILLSFSEPGCGFGEQVIIQTEDGVAVDTERMGKEFTLKCLARLLENAVFDTDTDPDKHRLYVRLTGSRCGEWCETCHPKTSSPDGEPTP